MNVDIADLLGSAIGDMGHLNKRNELATCEQAVEDVSNYCSLTTSWSKTLNDDETECYLDTLAANSKNPQAAVKAAVAHADYAQASSRMDHEINAVNQQLQSLEALLQKEGDFMKTIFGLAKPVNSFESFLKSQLAHRMG